MSNDPADAVLQTCEMQIAYHRAKLRTIQGTRGVGYKNRPGQDLNAASAIIQPSEANRASSVPDRRP